MRDWKLENLANGRDMHFRRSVPEGKKGVPLEVVYNFRTDFLKIAVSFDF